MTALDLRQLAVAVLSGGASVEREVSLASGAAVCDALASLGSQAPRRLVPVEVTTRGRWRWEGRELEPQRAVGELGADVFFLALHGTAGEDGVLQGFLETTGHVYTGSGVASSAASFDKGFARDLVAARGLRVAPAVAVDRVSWTQERAELLAALARLSECGLAVKPRSGGSSVGVRVLASGEDPTAAVDEVLQQGGDVLVEQRLAGIEVTCGVLGNRDGALRALTPVEIQPSRGAFFDYREKYAADGARELCPPQRLDEAACTLVREEALLAHRTLGCDGYSRSDFIWEADAERPVFLELNTLPGLTPRSLLPLAAAHDGLSFPELCREIVAHGLAARRATGGAPPEALR